MTARLRRFRASAASLSPGSVSSSALAACLNLYQVYTGLVHRGSANDINGHDGLNRRSR